jgi:hypothetical protein
MSWRAELNGDPLPWLLEPDTPGVRYLALRDLLDYPPDDPELATAREAAQRRTTNASGEPVLICWIIR